MHRAMTRSAGRTKPVAPQLAKSDRRGARRVRVTVFVEAVVWAAMQRMSKQTGAPAAKYVRDAMREWADRRESR